MIAAAEGGEGGSRIYRDVLIGIAAWVLVVAPGTM